MAKLSDAYESIMVINTNLGEEGIKALVEKFTTLITENGTLESAE